MTTILITGGAGYIGSHAVLTFRDAGYDVAVLDDLSTGVRANLPAEVRLHQGDVGDGGLLDRVLAEERPAAVLHFAGSIVVPESVADPAKYYRNNTATSLTLVDACVRHGIGRFVFSSTAAVYGLPPGGIADEDTPTAPINPYGRSKLMVEQMLADMSKAHGLAYAVLRYFNVAGADPNGRSGQSTPKATHLIKVACEVATGKRGRMAVYGTDYDTPDGTCVRDYIHVSDLADAHLAVLRHIDRTGTGVTFNCGNGRGYSVREVLDAMTRILGRPIPVDEEPRRAGDPAMLIADARRIADQIDWHARYTAIDDMVASALAWERKGP